MTETFQQKEDVVCNFILFFSTKILVKLQACKDMYAMREIVEYNIAYS